MQENLANYAVHKSSCPRIHFFMRERVFVSEEPCTCGLADLLSKMKLPDTGESEKRIFDLDVLGNPIKLGDNND